VARRKLLLGVILLFSINVKAQFKTADVGNLRVLVVYTTVRSRSSTTIADRASRPRTAPLMPSPNSGLYCKRIRQEHGPTPCGKYLRKWKARQTNRT
jgi:hypothetical protein